MREYFTIMIKENDTSNLKLLTEKLNDGFNYDHTTNVGRSTVITLSRYNRTETLSVGGMSEPVQAEYGSGITLSRQF